MPVTPRRYASAPTTGIITTITSTTTTTTSSSSSSFSLAHLPRKAGVTVGDVSSSQMKIGNVHEAASRPCARSCWLSIS